MLQIPGNIAGVKGIKYTGNKIKKWRDKLGLKQAGLYLAQLVRMQEEIGTGGGGFRYIYGAFLQQAYAFHPYDELLEISKNLPNPVICGGMPPCRQLVFIKADYPARKILIPWAIT